MSTSPTTVADLVFVGFNRRAAALHRETGEILWQWKCPKGSGAVALMLDGDRVIAAVQGYTYCLEAASGRELWRNDMSGFGLGMSEARERFFVAQNPRITAALHGMNL